MLTVMISLSLQVLYVRDIDEMLLQYKYHNRLRSKGMFNLSLGLSNFSIKVLGKEGLGVANSRLRRKGMVIEELVPGQRRSPMGLGIIDMVRIRECMVELSKVCYHQSMRIQETSRFNLLLSASNQWYHH